MMPVAPIRVAATGNPIGEAQLQRGGAYVALAPLSSLLDTITLFTVEQHIAFGVWLIAAFLAWRVVRRRRHSTSLKAELIASAAGLATLFLIYAAAAVLPRPMASLLVTRTDVIAIDFHAHTKYSHDARAGWSAADLLDWHTAAGYDAVYVTDHRTFDGVTEALALDSAVAGLGIVALPGLEAVMDGEHVNILNAGVRYKGLTTADLGDVDPQSLMFTSIIPNAEPVIIETLPGRLEKMIPAHGERTPGVRAIEVVDGSPRGLSQTRRDRRRIVKLADSLNLALVVGTDNHGWGRTAPGWALMRVPDWRGYTPDSLALRIEQAIRIAGRTATIAVERTPMPSGSASVAFALPMMGWTALATGSSEERVAWVVWIWVIWLAATQLPRLRETRRAAR